MGRVVLAFVCTGSNCPSNGGNQLGDALSLAGVWLLVASDFQLTIIRPAHAATVSAAESIQCCRRIRSTIFLGELVEKQLNIHRNHFVWIAQLH